MCYMHEAYDGSEIHHPSNAELKLFNIILSSFSVI